MKPSRFRHLLLLLATWVAIDMGAPALAGPFTFDLGEEPKVIHLRGARAEVRVAALEPAPAPARTAPTLRPCVRAIVRRDATGLARPDRCVPTARAHTRDTPPARSSEDH